MAGKSGPPKGGKRGKRPGAPLQEGDEGFGLQRLQKVLAAAGVASRRDCEELIRDGRVEVDGQPVTEMGVKVDPSLSEIRVDGSPLRKAKLVYYALNKPQGVVCTNYDPSGRPRVIDLLPRDERVFPVGRLDRASEGLILVTNDGAFANRVTHPRFGVDKTYIVRVAGKPDPKSLLQLRKGIWTSEGVCRVQSVHIKGSRGNSTDLIIVLNEGKNREIRRILARVGHKVLLLRRVAVGPVRLGKIEPGTFRRVTSAEIEALLEESRQKRRRGDKPDARPPRGEADAGGKPRSPAAVAKGGKPQAAELDDEDYDDELVAPERQVREEMLSPTAGLTGVQGDVIDFDDDDAPLPSSSMNLADLPLLDGDDDEDDDLQTDDGISAELLDDDFDSEEPGGWPDEDEDEDDDDFGGGAFREAGAAPPKAGRPAGGGQPRGSRGGAAAGRPAGPRGPRGGAGGGRPAGRGKPGAKPAGKGRGKFQGEAARGERPAGDRDEGRPAGAGRGRVARTPRGEGQGAETQSAGLGRAKFGKGKRPGGGKPLGGKPGGKRGAGKPRTGGGTSGSAGGGGQSDYGRRGAGRGKGGGKAAGGKPSGGKFGGGGGKGGRGKRRTGGGRG